MAGRSAGNSVGTPRCRLEGGLEVGSRLLAGTSLAKYWMRHNIGDSGLGPTVDGPVVKCPETGLLKRQAGKDVLAQVGLDQNMLHHVHSSLFLIFEVKNLAISGPGSAIIMGHFADEGKKICVGPFVDDPN